MNEPHISTRFFEWNLCFAVAKKYKSIFDVAKFNKAKSHNRFRNPISTQHLSVYTSRSVIFSYVISLLWNVVNMYLIQTQYLAKNTSLRLLKSNIYCKEKLFCCRTIEMNVNDKCCKPQFSIRICGKINILGIPQKHDKRDKFTKDQSIKCFALGLASDFDSSFYLPFFFCGKKKVQIQNQYTYIIYIKKIVLDISRGAFPYTIYGNTPFPTSHMCACIVFGTHHYIYIVYMYNLLLLCARILILYKSISRRATRNKHAREPIIYWSWAFSGYRHAIKVSGWKQITGVDRSTTGCGYHQSIGTRNFCVRNWINSNQAHTYV